MKLDNNSGNMSNNSRQTTMSQQFQQPQQTKRSIQSQPALNAKPLDIKDQKERLKAEKAMREKQLKEQEKQEKLKKEREKKEKKEQEKLAKKGAVPGSVTSSNLNQAKSNSGQNLPTSASENFLNRTGQGQKVGAPLIPKGRYRCQVVYLDESVKNFDIDKNALGEDLMTLVCMDLELIEKEYFSLTYRDVNNMKFWLDHQKKIKSQLKGYVATEEPVFNFEVKFYPPEPNVLQEEITRYLLSLQLRHDIMDGKLPCTFVTHALLGSYTVQAELGDYDELNNTARGGMVGYDYLEGFCFAPQQTPELLAAIANCHKDNKGQTPSEAEMHYLENAVKLAMYGVDLHNAKDSDGVDILIGVSASGLLVFRDHLRINRFAWPKILKISYKRNHFYLKLRPSEFDKYETTIGFRCPNHKAAKRLWKIAVEHHAFFRLREPESKSAKSKLLPNFNSNFRYTGSSTYMQSRHRSIERNQPEFTRSLSKRLTQSMDRGLAMENPNATPGSVQSAAFNNFNRTKQHQSLSNLRNQNNQMTDSQDDLDQAGEYTLNNNPRYDPQTNQYQQINNYQPQDANDTPINLPKSGLKSLLDRIPKDSANLSLRSNESNNTPSGIYQSVNPKNRQNNSYNQQGQQQQIQSNNNSVRNANQQANTLPKSFEQLDEYYTSVDNRNFGDDDRTPSNKISTPILNNKNYNQQQQNRYVPSRQINQQINKQQQQQQQYQDQYYQDDQYQDDQYQDEQYQDQQYQDEKYQDNVQYDQYGNQINNQYNQKPPKLGQQERKKISVNNAEKMTISSDDGVFEDARRGPIRPQEKVDNSYQDKQGTTDSYRSERSFNVLNYSGNSRTMQYEDKPSAYKESLSTILNYSGSSMSPGSITKQNLKLDDDIEYFGDENNVVYQSREVRREEHQKSVQQIRTVQKSPMASIADSVAYPVVKEKPQILTSKPVALVGLAKPGPPILPKPVLNKQAMDSRYQPNLNDQRQPSYTGSNSSYRNQLPSYQPQQNLNQSNGSYRNNNINQTNSNNSSYRSNQQLPAQPPVATNRVAPNISRPQPPPPPVPADRSIVNPRERLAQQQRQRDLEEQERQEYEMQQRRQYSNRQNSQNGSYSQQRQPSSGVGSIRGNEGSLSGSMISTPAGGSSRVRRDNDVNHKDLLLQAIKMATELDPNLEVEKVEITTED